MTRYIKKLYNIIIKITYKLVFLTISYVPAFKLYQPVFSKDDDNSFVIRNSKDRWNAMKPYLEKLDKGSVLDIGSNIGYFTFKTAELGHFSTGMESEGFNITVSNAIKASAGVDNANFIKCMITPEHIKIMPSYDTIINLSVFHHWVKVYGQEVACDMMRDLAAKCDNLVFETGQHNEKGTKWAERLSFMGGSPEVWIEEFLKDIGFNEVKLLGQFSTGLTDVKRNMYFASK